MKNVLTPLAKSVLIPLGLSAGMSGLPSLLVLHTTALIYSNEKMEDIMKIVKSVKESGLLTKGISETIKNEAKEQKRRFLPVLLGTLAPIILGNPSTGTGVKRAGEGVITADQSL